MKNNESGFDKIDRIRKDNNRLLSRDTDFKNIRIIVLINEVG
jgi:hypothetical protein